MPNKVDLLATAENVSMHFKGLVVTAHQGGWIVQAKAELMALQVEKPDELFHLASQLGRGPRSALTAYADYIRQLCADDERVVAFVWTKIQRSGGHVYLCDTPFELSGASLHYYKLSPIRGILGYRFALPTPDKVIMPRKANS